MTTPAFDSLADLYDLFQDWERRLPREIGVLRSILDREGARTVLDAACGTGTHLAALAEAGYEVTGADIAPEMAERARRRLRPWPGTEVHTVGFARVGEAVRDRDAVLVIGNSLPNAGSADGVRAALRGLSAAVRPGGVLLVHAMNFPLLTARGGGLGPVRRVVADGVEHLFLKLFEIHADKVVLDVIAVAREGEEVRTRLTRTTLHPLTLADLEAGLGDAGLTLEETRAGFSDAPFDPATSGDWLAVARRTASGG